MLLKSTTNRSPAFTRMVEGLKDMPETRTSTLRVRPVGTTIAPDPVAAAFCPAPALASLWAPPRGEANPPGSPTAISEKAKRIKAVTAVETPITAFLWRSGNHPDQASGRSEGELEAEAPCILR
ncbi:hypothetical protein AB656_04180 [Bifidobacterium actinocoloniiforme DSM 22766]|nr:hypothetical protein AB656_04180 [Bifidobacterium actinocoloniiforme DSM 22766]